MTTGLCVKEVTLRDWGEVSNANKEVDIHELACNLHLAVDELRQNVNL